MALAVHLRELVVQHDDRVTNLDAGVHDLRAVRRQRARKLNGAECTLVELDRLGGTRDDKVRGDRVEPLGDRLDGGLGGCDGHEHRSSVVCGRLQRPVPP
jgi:hypothetical protein